MNDASVQNRDEILAGVPEGLDALLIARQAASAHAERSGSMILRLGAPRFTALAMLVSTLATLIHFFITQPLSSLVQPLPVYGLGLAMAIVSTVIPVFAQSAAIRRLGAGPAALVGTVGPLMTILLGWWILGETISTWQIFGAILVVAGVMKVSKKS